MAGNWTFGQKLGAGFGLSVFLTVIVAGVAAVGLREVVQSKDRVILVIAENVIDAEDLRSARESRAASIQGFLVSKKDVYFDQALAARAEFRETLKRLQKRAASDEGRRLLEQIEGVEAEHFTVVERVLAIRRAEESPDAAARVYEEQVGPLRDLLDGHVRDFVNTEHRLLEEGRLASSDAASRILALTLAITAVAILLSATVATFLARSLARQIGASVSQVQSSSAELQSAANQQATGAREQSTAMSEISTTINELLATSKQISEGAQRVAHIAEETALASRAGEGTVEKSHESFGGIRKQVELIVGHMLDLGMRSQQIGVVLDIVSELAEQTNILAINATIEAAGAGEAGKRFAVVADEIRKLADRVAGSTKEIRGLIDDVRSSVNTTVMATESGSKAVAAGSRQFIEVASAFKHIAGLVSTTTDASREIELSTKQQTTAVEQVNLAILSVAQATKETEMSAGQVLQAASQLASLSRDLTRLIRPQTTGRTTAQT